MTAHQCETWQMLESDGGWYCGACGKHEAPEMTAAEKAIAAVLALHREMECRDEDNEPVGGSYCEECKDLDDHSGERVHEVYPCMTVREITAALTGAETFAAMRDRIERAAK